MATVLKTPDKGFDLLIKFLLSACDISAKLYPLQEQEESPSLQRGAHSVTCNYGIYCGRSAVWGAPAALAPHTPPPGTALVCGGPRCLALRKRRGAERAPAGASPGPAHRARPRPRQCSMKRTGLFIDTREGSHPGCWFQAGLCPFVALWGGDLIKGYLGVPIWGCFPGGARSPFSTGGFSQECNPTLQTVYRAKYLPRGVASPLL